MHKPSRTEIRSRLIAPRNPPVAAPPLAAHQCHEYLHLAAALGAHSQILPPQLRVTEDEVQTARAKFGLTSNQPWLALNPGAEYGPAKRWPADRFAAVAKNLEGAGAGRWILLGGRNDQPITAVIASQLRSALDLAGRTSLRELMALLSGCRILLTNDTGPMHVGAALGLPVIVPFGSTSPELTGPGVPGDPRHRLLRAGAPCAPCFLRDCPIDFRCMLGLEVEHVTAAALEALRPRG